MRNVVSNLRRGRALWPWGLVFASCLVGAGCSRKVPLTPEVILGSRLYSDSRLAQVQLYLSEELVLRSLSGADAMSIQDHMLSRQNAEPKTLRFKAELEGQGTLQPDRTLHVQFSPGTGHYLVFTPPDPRSGNAGYTLATRFERGVLVTSYAGKLWAVETDVSLLSLFVREKVSLCDEEEREVPGVDLSKQGKPDGGS